MSLPVEPPNAPDPSPPLALDEGRLAGELVRIGLPALIVVAAVAALLARDDVFVGSLDNEEIFAQGHALYQVWARGDAVSTRAFLDTPTPFTYSPTLYAFTLPLLALSRLTTACFAFDFLALATLLANGLTMYGLLRAAGLDKRAAGVGGFMLMLSTTVLVHGYVDAYLGQAFFLPLTLYLVLRDRLRGFRPMNWALFGVCVGLLNGAHEYLGLMGAGLLASALACNARRLGWRDLVKAGAAAGAGVFVITAPVLWMYLQQRAFDAATHTVFTRPIEHSIVGSCRLIDYLFPMPRHQICGVFPAWIMAFQYEALAAWLGVINLAALAVLALGWVLRRERVRAFLDASPFLRCMRCELLLWGVGGLVLTLGPRWKGASWIVLPAELLRLLPPFQMVRGWGRFAMVAFFVVTVVSAHLIHHLLRAVDASGPRRPAARAGFIVALLLAITVVDEVPVLDDLFFRVPFPTALATIRNERGDCLVMHLPLSWSTGPLHNGVAQVLQPFHGKRTVNGYNAFLPSQHATVLAESPLRPLMLWAIPGPPVPIDTLGRWLVDRDVRFIVYEHHTQCYVPSQFTMRDDVRNRVDTLRTLGQLQTRGWLSVIEDDDDYTVYRVEP